MADVFISHARSTEKQAQAAAEGLRSLGYSVWLDRELPTHRAYTGVIEKELAAAKAVLVIWSAKAVRSQWVMSEANRAREDDKLVQMAIDDARLPMPFDQIQCADLKGWIGDPDTHDWGRIIASVADLVGVRGTASPQVSTSAPASGLVIAVLPFDNLSGDADLLYFSDGVSEEILQTVTQTTGLRVIGRSSSFQFRGPGKATRRVAAELGCTHTLDGSVRRSGNRVRIAASLIECAGQTVLWSGRFERDLTDIFALQDEIAAAVAAGLKVAFAPSEDTGPIDPLAYELYLRSRMPEMSARVGAAAADWLNPADAALLREAIGRAPRFAQAWSAMAMAKAVEANSQPSLEHFGALAAEATKAAQTALSLDPKSGSAHAALSLLLPMCGAFAEREDLLARARAASPEDDFILFQSSLSTMRTGRISDAFAFATRARQLNPLNPHATFWHAFMLFHVGRQQEAFDVWELGRARWPDHPGMASVAMFYAATAGEWERVDRLYSHARERGKSGNIAAVDLLRRRPAEARETLLREAHRQAASVGMVLLNQAGLMAFMGYVDDVYELLADAPLERLFMAGDPLSEATGGIYPLFDAQNVNLRVDPRFVGLCNRLGLCSYWVKSDRWPDCAGEGVLPYDFKAECRRLAATRA